VILTFLTNRHKLQVDLTGGYYDAGDNVKFHFPLAFSMTMLAWSTIEYQTQLLSAGQLEYAKDALRWGTDYLLKCHTATNVFWGQVKLIIIFVPINFRYNARIQTYIHFEL
jgi:Glycosyl hydrolase family 9